MTQRTINWKVLAASAVAAVVLLLGLRLLHSWQLSRLADGLLRIAAAREHDEKWRDAATYCERYLRVHPNDAVVRGRLATDFAKAAGTLAEKLRAVDLHYRALSANPAQAETIALKSALAELLVETGRFNEAEREARAVMNMAGDHPTAQRALALAMFAQWENGSLANIKPSELQLIGTAQRARGLNPTDAVLAECTGRFIRDHASVVNAEPQLSDRDRNPDACLDDLVRDAGGDAKSYLARSRYRARYQLPGADTDIAKALEIAPDDPVVLLTAAKSFHPQAILTNDAGAVDSEVQSLLQRACELYQRSIVESSGTPSPESYVGLGATMLAMGDLEGAVSTWRSGLKKFSLPTIKIALQARIVEAYLNADRSGDASDSLDSIDELVGTIGTSVPRDERLTIIQSQNLRRAAWYMQRNQTSRAVPLLREAVAQHGSGGSGNAALVRAWTLLGRAQTQLLEWSDAAVAYDRAAPLEPQSSSIPLWSGLAWLHAGRPDLAVDRIEQSLVIRQSPEAMIQLVTAEIERQRTVSAEQQSWDRVERILNSLDRDEKLRQQLSSPWQIEFFRAELALARIRGNGDEIDRRKESIALIRQAESKYENSGEFWRLATTAYQRLGDSQAADRALLRYVALTKSEAERSILKSQLASLRGDLPEAQKLLEDAANAATAVDQQQLRQQLINVAFAKGDLELTEKLLTAEAQQQPGNISVLRRCCELASQRGNQAAARQWQRELAKAGEIGEWWARYFHAAQQISEATGANDEKLAVAVEEIEKLKVIRPHWPMPHALLGLAQLRRDKLKEATSELEDAIRLGERRLVVFEQLITLLDQQNRTADAEQYLSRLHSYMPLSQRLTEIASEYQVRGDHPQQALAIAREAVTKRNDDPLAHLWLARMLVLNNELDSAENEFKKSLELAPEDSRSWSGLFSYYLRIRKPQLARQTLEELAQKAKLPAKERSFALGQGYEVLGEWEKSATHYEEALRVAPTSIDVIVRLAATQSRFSPSKAEQTARDAVKLDPKSGAARRVLASILAMQGDPSRLQESESLLKSIEPSTSTVALEDRRLTALLLAQYGDVQQVFRAIELLEDVVEQSNGRVPGDELILARLYETQARISPDPEVASEKRNAAHKLLLSSVSRGDLQSGQFVALIEFLLRNNQMQEASEWLDKFDASLDARGKSDPATIGQLVELRLRHGSGDKAEKWLRKLAEIDSDPLRPVAIQAAWLKNQERSKEIEPLIEPVATKIIADATDNKERGRRAHLIGDLYAKTLQNAAAQRWYKQAAEYDATRFPALVRALVQSGDLIEATRICRERAKVDNSSQAAAVLASALAEVNSQDDLGSETNAFFRAQLKQYPQDAKLLYPVATLMAVQGRYEEAIQHYRTLNKLDSKNIGVLNNLAMILAETPDSRAESLQLINRAIEIAGQIPGLLDTKGAILVYQGEAKQALFILEAAAREAGNDARHRFHLAAAYHGVGDAAKAKQQLAFAMNLDLEKQVLTPTDRRILSDLKSALIQ